MSLDDVLVLLGILAVIAALFVLVTVMLGVYHAGPMAPWFATVACR